MNVYYVRIITKNPNNIDFYPNLNYFIIKEELTMITAEKPRPKTNFPAVIGEVVYPDDLMDELEAEAEIASLQAKTGELPPTSLEDFARELGVDFKRGFIGAGRAVLVAMAVLAVGLAGCGDDNGTNGGGSYDYVQLGGKKWMKKNLNIATADSWCYEFSTANCDKYGRLYTWDAAKAACQSVGWRLPSRGDWRDLVTSMGDEETAGKKLKSKNGWNENGNGTDDYKFSALPGGTRNTDGGFYMAGNHGFWWTATEDGSDNAYRRDIGYVLDNVYEVSNDRGFGFSVRCVKDY